MSRVYKILTAADGPPRPGPGGAAGAPDDRRDGFIHLSAADQVAATAERHFAGRGDLVLVEVKADGLAGLRWEVSRGGALFPHLHAPLPMSAVAGAAPLDAARAGAGGMMRS